jgi:hypothetical protein
VGGIGGLGGLGGIGGIVNCDSTGFCGCAGISTIISGGDGGGGTGGFLSWEITPEKKNSITNARQIFNCFIIKIFVRMQSRNKSIKKIPQMRDFAVGFGKLFSKSVRLLF